MIPIYLFTDIIDNAPVDIVHAAMDQNDETIIINDFFAYGKKYERTYRDETTA